MVEHPNATRLRRLYAVGSSGVTDWAEEALADDIVWHVPGRGANAGEHRGKEEVLAFFNRVIPGLESFKIEVHDILANDDHAAALVRYDHRREAREFTQLGAEICHFDAAGKISAFWALIPPHSTNSLPDGGGVARLKTPRIHGPARHVQSLMTPGP